MSDWITSSWPDLAGMALTAVLLYVGLIAVTRLVGLRSFSKMSTFDFAITVAYGSMLSTIILSSDTPLLLGLPALVFVFVLQTVVAKLRDRFDGVRTLVDNQPVLLMAGQTILHENLRRGDVTVDDLYAKLREANVLHFGQVRAVVMEATGDVSVLHAGQDGDDLDLELLSGVCGAEHLEGLDHVTGSPNRSGERS